MSDPRLWVFGEFPRDQNCEIQNCTSKVARKYVYIENWKLKMCLRKWYQSNYSIRQGIHEKCSASLTFESQYHAECNGESLLNIESSIQNRKTVGFIWIKTYGKFSIENYGHSINNNEISNMSTMKWNCEVWWGYFVGDYFAWTVILDWIVFLWTAYSTVNALWLLSLLLELHIYFWMNKYIENKIVFICFWIDGFKISNGFFNWVTVIWMWAVINTSKTL